MVDRWAGYRLDERVFLKRGRLAGKPVRVLEIDRAKEMTHYLVDVPGRSPVWTYGAELTRKGARKK